MTYKEVKKLIFENLKDKLNCYGFKGKISYQGYQFTRKTTFGKHYIIGGITNYVDEFNTSLYIGIRFNVIEKILDLIIEERSKNNDSGTFGVTYADYLKVNSFVFEIFTEKDVEVWIDEIMLFLNQFGFEFFDKYYELEQLDELFNKYQNLIIFQKDPHIALACKGLIIAKLVNNPEYEQLTEKYLLQYQGNSLKYLLENTVSFLAKHSREELLENF